MRCPKCGFVEIGERERCRCCDSPLHHSVIPFPVNQSDSDRSGAESTRLDWRLEVKERTRAFRARRRLVTAREGDSKEKAREATEVEDHSSPPHLFIEAALKRHRSRHQTELKESPTPLLPQAVGDGSSPPNDPPLSLSSRITESRPPVERTAAENDRLGAPRVKSRTSHQIGIKPREDALISSGTALTSTSPSVAGNLPQAPSSRPRQWDIGERNAIAVSRPEVELDDLSIRDEDGARRVEEKPGNDLDSSKTALEDTTKNEPLPSSPVPASPASFMRRVGAGIVDALILILVNIPFAAMVEFSRADFADRRIQLVLGGIAFILFLFYTSLMLMAEGQTIGMMATGIIAVDARSSELPSFTQSLRRVLGTILSAAPALLGFLVPAFDSRGRSLSDMLSGTRVKTATIEELHAPWLYHHVET